MLESILPMFSSKSFIVSNLTFRSLIYLEIIFVYGVRKCSNFILLNCPVFPASLIEETIFSPLYILAFFIKNKLPIGVWVYLWAFYLVPLFYISVFMPVPHCLFDCSFVVQSQIRKIDSSSSIILFQDCFGYSGSFVFSYEL